MEQEKSERTTFMERLDKLLAGTGQWSRREVHQLVKEGRVALEGRVLKKPEEKFPSETIFLVDGTPVGGEVFLYLMLHKPAGVVSATEDAHQKTVLDLLPPQYKKAGLFPVGRLDIDTEGLLLLTNDGSLAHKLLSPKHHVDKTYLVQVEGELDEGDVQAFNQGILLGDGLQCMPAILQLRPEADWGYITIQEGKFHQIKRMMASRNKPVCYLKRLRMGTLQLDEELPLGMWRPLCQKEIDALKIQ